MFDVLNSGLPVTIGEEGFEQILLDFTVEIGGDPGDVMWAVSLADPNARMRIEVVPGDQATLSPAEVAARVGALQAGDREVASDAHRRLSDRRPHKKLRSGATQWRVRAGVRLDDIYLGGFYPKRLAIKTEDRVRWTFPQPSSRWQSVTFPAAQGLDLADRFPIVECDRDGDFGTEPETRGSDSFPFCDEGFDTAEFTLPERLLTTVGNEVVSSGRDLESSGLRGGDYAPTAAPYVLRFGPRTSGNKLRYVGMWLSWTEARSTGVIRVKGR